MELKDVVANGVVRYPHFYMQTLMGVEVVWHEIQPPKQLLQLVDYGINARLVQFDDFTLGIEYNGTLWAAEDSVGMGCYHLGHPVKSLPLVVWQYCHFVVDKVFSQQSITA